MAVSLNGSPTPLNRLSVMLHRNQSLSLLSTSIGTIVTPSSAVPPRSIITFQAGLSEVTIDMPYLSCHGALFSSTSSRSSQWAAYHLCNLSSSSDTRHLH